MSRTSLRRTLEAIDTQPIALVVALAGSDLERSIAKQALSKSIELPSNDATFLSHAREVGAVIEKAAAP
jgi:hypothetical protein